MTLEAVGGQGGRRLAGSVMVRVRLTVHVVR
jgi:hypothetical protein